MCYGDWCHRVDDFKRPQELNHLGKIAHLFFALLLSQNLFGVSHAQDLFPSFPLEILTRWQTSQTVLEESPIDVLHYDVHLQIQPASRSVRGSVKMTLSVTDPTATSFYLDWIRMSFDSLLLNGQRLQPDVQSQRIVIGGPGFLDASNSMQLQVYYHGQPGNDGFGGFFFTDRWAWTVGEGLNTNPPSMLRYWVPSHDVPDDKATWDFFLTVSEPLQAIANGLLVSAVPSDDGMITYHWREGHPMATYLAAVSIGNFAGFSKKCVSITGDSIPLQFYTYPEHLELAKEDWKEVGQMIAIFEGKFGPYPFEKYGMVELPMRGAMEHQTLTSYSSTLVTGDNRYDYVVAHELAHQWWGDWITLADWRDIWLNEGFATYCEALYAESFDGQQGLQNAMSAMASSYFSEVGRLGPFPTYNPDYLWGATVYEKGAWILHMLRRTVGDSLFWKGMKSYGQTFAYKTATTEDFRRIMETVTGNDLRRFFDQWVYESGFPDLNAGWEVSRGSGDSYEIALSIGQTQSVDHVFSLPLEVAIDTDSGTLLDTVQVTQRSETFVLQVPDRPITLTLDPDGWLLKKLDMIYQPLPSGLGANEYGLAQNYPNPFSPGAGDATTAITFQIGMRNSPALVLLTVYDVLGRQVRVLEDKMVTAGLHTYFWDGLDELGRPVPSGIYLYQLRTGEKRINKRMCLLRR
jgi:aminopeptidase N